MRFGALTTSWEPFSYTPSMYIDIAQRAEELGYEYFLVTDHFMRPLLRGEVVEPKRHSTLDAWVLLSYIAAKTSRIRLGTCVTPLPMRHPPILAKSVATLDILSGGRVILGAGAGYDEGEYRAYSSAPWEPPRERVRRTREALSIIKLLWTQERVDFNGTYYRIEGAVLEPKPLQRPHPPIWMGSMSNVMLKIAAEFADVWIPSRALGASLEFYREKSAVLRREAERRGRKVRMSIMGYISQPGSKPPIEPIASMDRAAEVLGEYASMGCEEAAIMFYPPDRYEEMMRQFLRDVAPSL